MSDPGKSRFTYANVASTAALLLVVVGGGTAVAAGGIPRNSVGSPQIIDHSVKAADLAKISSPKVFGSSNLGVVRAYAWNNLASSGGTLSGNGYTYNRSGQAVTTTHPGTGSYSVTFAGLNLNGGNVVVSGYGSGATWCKVGGWSSDTVSVYCFNGSGTATDSLWTIAISD